MKTNAVISKTLFWALMVFFPFFSQSQGYIGPGIIIPDDKAERTSSPYFFVHSDETGTDLLPLKSTKAEVKIAGVIADVKVIQVYKNEGKKVLEALYIFPASTRAAVYDMRMTIGERTIVAKIEESQKARIDYEQARQEGKTASLLEQERPNVFQMNVSNILPGDTIRVELSYTELIIPEKGVYEFVYPTVVGPRYTGQQEANSPSWAANPYSPEGVNPFYTFGIDIELNSAIPVTEIRSTSHNVDIRYKDKYSAVVKLTRGDHAGGNKDFILQYRLTGDKIESGITLYEGREENFFLAMIQPPRYVTPDILPPREYVFIVDVSGSMYGYPLDVSKKLLKDLIGSLRPADRFNVLLFAGDSRLLSERSLEANNENINRAIRMIEDQSGSGGTEILPALQRALALTGTENYSRTFIIATDGYVTVEREVFDLIRKNLGHANFFSFGIGTSVNRYIIEGIAHAGMGIPFIATDASEAVEMAKRFREYVQFPVLSGIEVEYNGFDVYDVEPLSVPDVFSERPVILFGKWRGVAKGSVEINGLTARTCYKQSIPVEASKVRTENEALTYLWARERIRTLDDYAGLEETGQLAGEITQLGLKYNLLTRYTSFIAIDSEVRNQGGEMITVAQPLPLPEGVSNYAVGGVHMGAVPGIMGNGRNQSNGAIGKLYGGKAKAGRGKETMDYAVHQEVDPDGSSSEQMVFLTVEEPAVFNWMGLSLEEFIDQHIQIPWLARSQRISGSVFVSFIIETDGSVSKVQVFRGLGYGCDEEALRLIELTSSFWTPARQRGMAVRMQMMVPVKFKRE